MIDVASVLISNEKHMFSCWNSSIKQLMKRRGPCFKIIDGDIAMKNAIKKVFPIAHHMSCV